jgi:hypothetical protein
MKNMVMLLLLGLCLLATVGCSTTRIGTMNVQRSGLRASGDLSVTVMLDRVALEDLEETKGRVKTFLDQIEEFAATGEIVTLTRTELTTLLLNKVSPKYTPWVLTALDAALLATDATAPIGDNNQRRIIAFVNGSRQAVALYNAQDRADKRTKAGPKPVPDEGVPDWP